MSEIAGLTNGLQWFQLIAIIVGFITVLVKVGNTQGKQEEKNKNYEDKLATHSEALNQIGDSLTSIKLDVREVKTYLGIK